LNIVRNNLMTDEGYTPYCGRDAKCSGRWPRMVFTGKQFKCPSCGWETQYEPEFIKAYLEKWNLLEKHYSKLI
jgi:hypothetical protein